MFIFINVYRCFTFLNSNLSESSSDEDDRESVPSDSDAEESCNEVEENESIHDSGSRGFDEYTSQDAVREPELVTAKDDTKCMLSAPQT